MVDAGELVKGRERVSTAGIAPEPGFSARAWRGPDAVARYHEIAAGLVHGPAQSPHWVEAWAKATGADIITVAFLHDEEPLAAVALEIRRRRGVVEVVYPGCSHANGNFCAVAPGKAPAPGIALQLLCEALREHAPEAGLLALERQQPDIAGHANILIGKNARPSPNVALAVGLGGGFDNVLARHSGKRKRKKHRSHGRKFDEMGGVKCFDPASRKQVLELLDGFFAMKAARFAELGIADVFAAAEVRSFFQDLFGESFDRGDGAFTVRGMTVGDRLWAVTANTLCGERTICEFSAFAPDTTGSNTSPGEYLFYENIALACQQKLAVFDFSVGDEPYKRDWCDIETMQFDTLAALSAGGRLPAFLRVARAAVTRAIKGSPFVTGVLKSVRKAAGRR